MRPCISGLPEVLTGQGCWGLKQVFGGADAALAPFFKFTCHSGSKHAPACVGQDHHGAVSAIAAR
ncbi:hypothetical protein ROBYS_27730 [Roseobacter sp. OBYS 0001]|nr:hypothetical protein ROBYS_27730 [Roseobacter sp. OBYS 0001]